jgi:hypothetical protein
LSNYTNGHDSSAWPSDLPPDRRQPDFLRLTDARPEKGVAFRRMARKALRWSLLMLNRVTSACRYLARVYDAAVARGRERRRHARARRDEAYALVRDAARAEAILRALAFPVTTGDPGGPHRIIAPVCAEGVVFADTGGDALDLGLEAAHEALRNEARYIGGNAVIFAAYHFDKGVAHKRKRTAEAINHLLQAGGEFAKVSLPLLETVKSRPFRRVTITGTAVRLEAGAVGDTAFSFNRPIEEGFDD